MNISNTIKKFAAVAAVTVSGLAFLAMPVSAKGLTNEECAAKFGTDYISKGGTCVLSDDFTEGNLWSTVSTIINWILGIVGVIAVVMIIIGGIQYTVSAGDSGKVKKAKDTILYGIIGLVIALLAAAIVNFVLDGIFSGNSTSAVTTSVIA